MTTPQAAGDILGDLNLRYERAVPLGPRTWYGVGGMAEVLAHPCDIDQLAALMHRCRDTQTPLRVLGSGANLLVRDVGVPGVVVVLDDPAWRRITFDDHHATIHCGAGVDLTRLVAQSARQGLAGLAHLAGIPASVGGAIRMNAGGHTGDTATPLATIDVILDDAAPATLKRRDLSFGYRCSNIPAPLILGACFALQPEDPKALRRAVKDAWTRKRQSQPLADHTAGCSFKNPDPLAQPACVGKGAGQLIDEAGLKGTRIGGAVVSSLHANFIVAEPGAAADDVLAVMDRVAQGVWDRLNVRLDREVVVWPDDA